MPPHHRNAPPLWLLIAAAIFLGQVVIVQFGGGVFRTVPLSLTEWVVIVLATSPVLWIGEVLRLIARLKATKAPA